MSLNRVLSLAKRIVFQFLRDKRTLVLLFLVPVIVMSLLGYVFTAEIKHIKVAVVNNDTGAVPTIKSPQKLKVGVARLQKIKLSEVLISAIKDDETFKVFEMSDKKASSALKRAEVKATIVFGKNFTKSLFEKQHSSINLILEGSDPQVVRVAIGGVNKIAIRAATKLSTMMPKEKALFLQRKIPVTVERKYLHGGEDFKSIDYFAPVFIPIFAFLFVFLLTSVSFLRERSRGTMERIIASPLLTYEIILGYLLGFSIFALAQSLVILLFAIYILKIHYVGNLFVIFLVEMILTIGAVNLGIFLSTFAKNELQVIQFIPLVIVPQVILSGIAWPVEAMPKILQGIAYIMPLTYANFALKSVMIKGFGVTDIGFELAILSIFAILMLILSVFTLRKESY